MKKLLAISAAVIADAIRRKVIWVVAVFAALLAIAIPSLPSYGVGVVAAVYREVAMALMFVASLVVALSLSTTRIPQEVERRTVFNVLGRDVRRWQYIAGTWFGMFVVLGVVVGAFALATIAVGALTYQVFMWRLLEGALAIWLETGVIMAFAVMLSALFGPVTSVVGALAFTFIGHAVISLPNLPEGARAPWYFPSLDIFNVINPVAHGSGYGFVYGASMMVAFFAWVVLLLAGGTLLFGSRDL